MISIRLEAASSQPDNILLTKPGKYFPGEEVVKAPSRDGIGHYRTQDGRQHRFVLFVGGEPVAGILVDARRKWKGMQSAVVTQSHSEPKSKAVEPLRPLLNYARSQFRRLVEQEEAEAPEMLRSAQQVRQGFLSKQYSPGESAIVVIRVPAQITHLQKTRWPKGIIESGGPAHYTLIYVPGPHDDQSKLIIQKVVAEVASGLSPFTVEMPKGYQEFPTLDKQQKVVYKGADPESAAQMENIADSLEQSFRAEGLQPKRFPEFIAHATLDKLPKDESFTRPTPEGSFKASALELWGWPETIVFPFGGQSGQIARQMSEALEAAASAEGDESLDKTGGKLRDLALSTALGLAGATVPQSTDAPIEPPTGPARQIAPKPQYMMPTKFKSSEERAAHKRAKDYLSAVTSAAEEAGITPELLDAIVWVESKYKPGARSGVGAMGLVQMMPATAKDLEQRLKLPPVDFSKDDSVLRAGAQYLKYLLKKYKGRANQLELAVAAYNAGEGNVRRHNYQIPPFKETQDYVQRVMARMRSTPINIPLEYYGLPPSPVDILAQTQYFDPEENYLEEIESREPAVQVPQELAVRTQPPSRQVKSSGIIRVTAKDHLTEDPEYYTKLKKFEQKASVRLSSAARRSALS
jgi:lysozyme